MASKVVLMNALFDQFNSFLGELAEMYPNDSDFPMFSTTLKMVRLTNPSMVVTYINDSVGPFESQILSKDEKFFLDYSYNEFQSSVDINIFSKLKDYVKNMNSVSKNNVWSYIQNIVRLCKAITKM